MGFDTSDDAAVYKISDDVALIFTMDFFPPITGNAYMFGQIAASNALSDVYAMGGEPKLALNLFCFPSCMPKDMATEILRGGFDKVREAGCILCGGHTINDDVPKYGLSVNGFVHPNKILRNTGAKEGDILILTKPIGSGVLTTATKGGLIKEEELGYVYNVMAFLNKIAKDVLVRYRVNALTDITGFGLLGHAYEMARASGVRMEISAQNVPMFSKALEYASMGILPAGVYANRAFVGEAVEFIDVTKEVEDVLFDPQTAGGLLIAVEQQDAMSLYKELSSALEASVCGAPTIIGRVTSSVKERGYAKSLSCKPPLIIVKNNIEFDLV